MGRTTIRRGICSLALAAATAAAGAQPYAVDFVATASDGAAMDPTGNVIAGTTTLPPACADCVPTFGVPALWLRGVRHLLSLPPGAAYISFAGINAQGWVAGTAMRLDATGGAGYVWVPRADGSAFDAQPLGSLPGYQDGIAAGIDDQNRVFGLARTWAVAEAPFVWSDGVGMQDLRTLGYPDEAPAAVSPGGTVATASLTYRFGDINSVSAVTPPPAGFLGLSFAGTGAVNDAGMRASFLLSTSGTSSGYRYLSRHTEGLGWQVLGGPVIGSSPRGIGSVDPQGAITGTLGLSGFRAAGPDGSLAALTGLVSPAYPGAEVTVAGDQGDDGSILAMVVIGRSERLAKLVPVQACTDHCLRVSSLKVSGRMVSAPGQPGQCVEGARNQVKAGLTVVDETGAPVRGATVRGRFLDDYFLDAPVTLTTTRRGTAVAKHIGPACVGAVAFLVDSIEKAGHTHDRSTGVLTGYVIPSPRR